MHLSELCRDSDIDVIVARLRQLAPLDGVAPAAASSDGDTAPSAAGVSNLHQLWSYQDNDGRTAFHWAIALKNFDLARQLMQAPHNAPVLSEDEEMNTPFATACRVGAPLDLIQEILDRSVAEFAAYMEHKERQFRPRATLAPAISPPPTQGSSGSTGVDTEAGAAPDTSAEKAAGKVLNDMPGLQRPADDAPATVRAAIVNAPETTGHSPLLLAVARGHIAIARFLLENGADLSHQNVRGQSALHRAVNTGNMELVDFLVSTSEKRHAGKKAAHRRWLDLQDLHGDSALFYASMDNNEEMGRYLLRHGADRELRNTDGKAFWEV